MLWLFVALSVLLALLVLVVRSAARLAGDYDRAWLAASGAQQ